MPSIKKMELETVLKLSESLNHYQLLKIKPAASPEEVREAFHREAIHFHPDQYFQEQDAIIKDLAKQIYTRLVSAYRTLIDVQKRRDYDRSLNRLSRSSSGPQLNSFEELEDADTGARKKSEPSQSAPANRFFKLAQAAFQSKNFAAALMNIKIAINADPENLLLKDFLIRVENESKKAKA